MKISITGTREDYGAFLDFSRAMTGCIIGGEMVVGVETNWSENKGTFSGELRTKSRRQSENKMMDYLTGKVFAFPPLYQELPCPANFRFVGPSLVVEYVNAVAGQEPARGVR